MKLTIIAIAVLCTYVHRYTASYIPQQNYLAKTDLDGFVLLYKNPILMSVWVMVTSYAVPITISLGTLVPNSRDRQEKPYGFRRNRKRL